jgi:hypothetical protein
MRWIFDENENRCSFCDIIPTKLDRTGNGKVSSEGVAALDVHFALLQLGPSGHRTGRPSGVPPMGSDVTIMYEPKATYVSR